MLWLSLTQPHVDVVGWSCGGEEQQVGVSGVKAAIQFFGDRLQVQVLDTPDLQAGLLPRTFKFLMMNHGGAAGRTAEKQQSDQRKLLTEEVISVSAEEERKSEEERHFLPPRSACCSTQSAAAFPLFSASMQMSHIVLCFC